MFNKIKYLFLFLFTLLGQLFLIFTPNCQAASLMESVPTCLASGDCKLNDFVSIGIALTQLLLGITGSLALGAFVYGGILMLVSSGKSETVTKAKSVIFGAVIGMVIVFASWTIIGYIIKTVAKDNTTKDAWSTVGGFQPK